MFLVVGTFESFEARPEEKLNQASPTFLGGADDCGERAIAAGVSRMKSAPVSTIIHAT
jgi:hypothetical protein